MHDLEQEPLDKAGILRLMRLPDGGMRDPVIDIGGRVILGCDKPFIDRALSERGDQPLPDALVYGRPRSGPTQMALAYLREKGMEPTLHDLEQNPLSEDEILDLLYLPRLDGMRAPVIIHYPADSPASVHFILGADFDRMIEVFG
jgi:hypothetical protein